MDIFFDEGHQFVWGDGREPQKNVPYEIKTNLQIEQHQYVIHAVGGPHKRNPRAPHAVRGQHFAHP
jgi:hypothetical protein